MKILALLLLIPNFAFAWTLNNNFAASFKDSDVKVVVDSSTTCSEFGMTVDDLESLIGPAVDEYWNSVPTSALKLDAAGFGQSVNNINTGRLCSPTDDPCITQGNTDGDLIPATEDIIIACNNKLVNFGSNSVLAVTIPVKFTGKKIKGAIILLNRGSDFGDLSRADKIAVLAHEIGHAIGLGHSEEKSALMYYRTVNQRRRLGQDDVDGVSFLYPMKIDLFGLSEGGLLGGCGTIDTNSKNGPQGPNQFLSMIVSLFLMVLGFHFWKRFRPNQSV